MARLGMARSFQISAVFPHLTVRENIGLALQRRTGKSFKFWLHESTLDPLDRRIEEWPRHSTCPLMSTRRRWPWPMAASARWRSRRRWRSIRTWCSSTSRWPAFAEDDIDRVAAMIKDVARSRTVLMVEHNISVVARLSDVITVLTRGRVLAEGPYAEIARNPAVQEAYMGTSHG